MLHLQMEMHQDKQVNLCEYALGFGYCYNSSRRSLQSTQAACNYWFSWYNTFNASLSLKNNVLYKHRHCHLPNGCLCLMYTVLQIQNFLFLYLIASLLNARTYRLDCRWNSLDLSQNVLFRCKFASVSFKMRMRR